jgi:hypothetical protein
MIFLILILIWSGHEDFDDFVVDLVGDFSVVVGFGLSLFW